MKYNVFINNNVQKMITIIIVQMVIFSFSVNAQHKFSIWGGGGLSSLDYSVTTAAKWFCAGKHNNGFGGHFGLGYNYSFSNNLSITTGFEYARYRARFNADSLYSVHSNAIDIEDGSFFEYRSIVTKYDEKQNASFLQIPIMVQYEFGNQKQFFVAGGVKFALPLSGKHNYKANTFNNSGYYSEENYEYEKQLFVGFGEFNNRASKGAFELKTAYLTSFEAGGIIKMFDDVWSLYIGAYFDYALNNTVNLQSLPLVEYNSENPYNFTLNSVTNSQYIHNDLNQSFTNKINPIAIGVKLRLSFDFSLMQENKRKKPTVRRTPVPPRKTVPPSKPATTETAPSPAPPPVETEPEEFLWSVKSYMVSETTLSDTQKQELDVIIAMLQQNPETKFYIYGHSCDIGNARANEKISLQRAEQVKKYVLSKGISEKRILGIAAKGDTEPLLPNINDENRRINRRVEIKIIE